MKWILIAVLAGALAASPFLTCRALGTKEAYNYSLAVADAVTQFRAGEVPMLVGQTEYAFNGRIHPLRTAPGLAYAAALLDLVTFRQLGFWTLQNLVLAISLLGGAAAAYAGLRLATPATPCVAALLAGAYVLSPPVLAAAYGMDLFMTVLATPFVPLVIAANVSALAERQRPRSALLGLTLAAAWLAHPPIALWLTLATVALQAIALLTCPPDRLGVLRTVGAIGLAIVLAGFGLVSALTASPYASIVHQHDTTLLQSEVSRVFAASLRPVSDRADQLGDFQVGYTVWVLTFAALLGALFRRTRGALALVAVAVGLLCFTLPVPFVHSWLWDHVPTLVLNLTNQWPMQRLYLPFTALGIFAFALVWRTPATGRLGQDALRLTIAALAGWTVWQAGHFLGRGFATRQSIGDTASSHLATNLDLTPISYALLGTPPDFTNGTMDPGFGFRLLRPFDAQPVATNWTAPMPESPGTRHLRLEARAGDADDILDLTGELNLEAGRRYRLTFAFAVPPRDATLQIRGLSVRREYRLPSAGGPLGFGMAEGNNPAISLWTDRPEAERVTFRLVGPGLARSSWRGQTFAEVRVEPVIPAALPVELRSLLPLQARVTAPGAGYLETPRMFLPGYSATVDGGPARVQRSPDGRVMLAVPAGQSMVEVRYRGSNLLRLAFWLTAAGWMGVTAWSGRQLFPASLRTHGRELLRRAAQARDAVVRRIVTRRGLLVTAALLLAAAGAAGWQHWQRERAAIGPLQVRFVLPRGETNRQQPLVVTGKPQAGLFVYVVYADPEHVRIGVDSWGRFGFQSEPIRTDYFAEQELVVDAGALYPPDHPDLRALPPELRDRLRTRLRLEFNGQVVLDRAVDTHTSAPREVTVGRNRIGGSSCEPDFAGEILRAERRPIPNR